jgi:hypothetical protein
VKGKRKLRLQGVTNWKDVLTVQNSSIVCVHITTLHVTGAVISLLWAKNVLEAEIHLQLFQVRGEVVCTVTM